MNATDETTKRLNLLYAEFPEYFVWSSKDKHWAPKSYEHLKMVGESMTTTFREAAEKLRLLQSDQVIDQCLQEAMCWQMPTSFRRLFATMLVFCDVPSPHVVERLVLTENMRAKEDPSFCEYLMRVGNETEKYVDDNSIEIPKTFLVPYTNELQSYNSLLDIVFPNLMNFSCDPYPLMKREKSTDVTKSSVQKNTFDGSRKDINAAIDQICEFTGTKIIFWDLREPFIDNLYKPTAAQSRFEALMDTLKGQIQHRGCLPRLSGLRLHEGETADPSGFDVFPGLLRPWKRKSSALTSIGFLQIFPLTNTAIHIKQKYIPAALESLTATQKSCKGLGSDACANEDANAKTARETMSNLRPILAEKDMKLRGGS
nr:protein unc-13 homolog [Ipomoea batatas]